MSASLTALRIPPAASQDSSRWKHGTSSWTTGGEHSFSQRHHAHQAPRSSRQAFQPMARGLFWKTPNASTQQQVKATTTLAPTSTATLKSVYSTGKPLNLDLPKLSYMGRMQAGNVSGGISWYDSPLVPPELSKSDQRFVEELGIQFVEGPQDLNIDELNDLFELVGFPRRSPQRLGLALQHTHRVLWVRCVRRSRHGRVGKLVGFARATSDGSYTATIWDVAVNPQWQKAGMGTGMIERLLVGLIDDGIPTVTLYAEPHVVKMYERLGFIKDTKETMGDEEVSSQVSTELVGTSVM